MRLIILFVLAVPSGAAADAFDDRVAAALDPSGTHALAKGFLLEGSSLSADDRFERATCHGYLAFSRGVVSDVDVFVYTRTGQLLGEDRNSAGYGYVRLCGATSLGVHVAATAFVGQGEVRLYRLASAPTDVSRLAEQEDVAMGALGAVEGERDVGELPPQVGPDGRVPWGDDGALRALGYTQVGDTRWTDLGLAGADIDVELPAGTCSQVLAFAPAQRGVGLSVSLPTREVLHAHAPSRDRASVVYCPRSALSARVRVRPRVPRGPVSVRVYAHGLPLTGDISGLSPSIVAKRLELAYVAASHGLTPTHVEDVWLEPGAVTTRPLGRLPPGCVALMILPDDDVDIDARWLDAEGHVLAVNEGRSTWPVLYTCDHPGPAAVRLRGRGHAGRARLWLSMPAGEK